VPKTIRQVVAVLSGVLLPFGGLNTPLSARQDNPSSQPVAPPADDDQAAAIEAQIAAEIELIKPEAPEATGAEDASADTRRRLLDSLVTYHTLVKDHKTVRAQLRSLSGPQAAGDLAAELAAIQKRIDELKRIPAANRVVVTDAELDTAKEEAQAVGSDLAAWTYAHADRTKRLATASARKDVLAAEAQKAQAELLEGAARYEAKRSAATNDADRLAAAHELRSAQIAASLALLRQEHVDLEVERDTRVASQTEQRLPLLRELADQLERRYDQLKHVQSQAEERRVRDWVDYVVANPKMLSRFEQAYWALRLQIIEALNELHEMGQRAALADRYSEERYLDLVGDLADEVAVWDQFMESLRRRPREQIKDRYRELRESIRTWHAARESLQTIYDQVFDDRATIESRLDVLDDGVRTKFRHARDVVSPQGSTVRDAELRQELALAKQAFDEGLDATKKSLSSLAERIHAAIRAVEDHVDGLLKLRTTLYWTDLKISDQPIWRFRLSRFREEWKVELAGQAMQSEADALGKGLKSVPRTTWLTLAALVTGVLCLALVARSKLRRRAADLEGRVELAIQASGTALAPLSDRLHIQGMRFFARTATIVWPAFVLWAWVAMSPLRIAWLNAALAFAIAVSVASSLISVFSRTKRAFRLVPCEDVVATYIRRWLRLLLWISIVMVPLPLFLTVMRRAYYTKTALWSVYNILLLILVLICAARRQTLLKIVERPDGAQPKRILIAFSKVFPIVYLAGVGMLVAQILGYSALTTYLLVATSASMATILGAASLLRYITDLAAKVQRRASPAGNAGFVASTPSQLGRSAAFATGREVALLDPGDGAAAETPIAILTSLLRLAVSILAVILVLRFWGVSWVELRQWLDLEVLAGVKDVRPPVTLGRGLLAIIIVAASWLVSRSIRSILERKVYPAYGHLDRGGQLAVNTVLHYVLVFFGLYFAMYLLNIPLGALTVVLGTLGLGLGLGLQPLFLNFLSGLVMLFERHLKVGDVVEVDGVLGEVTNIRIRATTIKTYDNVDIVVPNGDFISGKVINWTLKDQRIRGRVEVGVAYGSDPRLAERLLLQVAAESPLVLAEPAPRVRFTKFGDNSLDFVLYAWFNNVADRLDFITDSRYRIMELFHQNGVDIPFPQRALTITGGQPIRVQMEPSAAASDLDHRSRPDSHAHEAAAYQDEKR